MSGPGTDMDEVRGRLSALEILVGEALVLCLAAGQDPKAVAGALAVPPESFLKGNPSDAQRQWAQFMHENIMKCAVENAVRVKVASQAVPAVFAAPRPIPPGRN